MSNKKWVLSPAEKFLNWSALSEHKKRSKDTIRPDRISKDMEEDIKQLLYYIECWMNCKDLTTKEDLKNKVMSDVQEDIDKLIAELRKFGKKA